jgi:hypothetical protein
MKEQLTVFVGSARTVFVGSGRTVHAGVRFATALRPDPTAPHALCGADGDGKRDVFVVRGREVTCKKCLTLLKLPEYV